MDIGAPELIIVLIIVVLLFGPGRLAGLGGEIGRSIREFREGLQGDQDKSEPEKQEVSEPTQAGPAQTGTVEASKDQSNTVK
jgi:sec-independent protein translocase protein TatA